MKVHLRTNNKTNLERDAKCYEIVEMHGEILTSKVSTGMQPCRIYGKLFRSMSEERSRSGLYIIAFNVLLYHFSYASTAILIEIVPTFIWEYIQLNTMEFTSE